MFLESVSCCLLNREFKLKEEGEGKFNFRSSDPRSIPKRLYHRSQKPPYLLVWFHCIWELTKHGWYHENSWSLFHSSLVLEFGQDYVQMYCSRKVNWGYHSTPLSWWIFKAFPPSNTQPYLDINRDAQRISWLSSLHGQTVGSSAVSAAEVGVKPKWLKHL